MRIWSDIFRRHYSDERLLAFADAELPGIQSYLVRRHLSVCWRCRARHAELNDQAQSLASALERGTFPGPERIAAARSSVLTEARKYERQVNSTPRFQVSDSLKPSLKWAIGALVLTAFIGGVWRYGRPPVMSARQVLAEAESVEERIALRPLQQKFRLEIAQIGSDPAISAGELEVWSDQQRGRSASRWTGDDGRIKHAVWRPSSDRLYAYDGRTEPVLITRAVDITAMASFADMSRAGISPLELERTVMRWLESRDMRPISMSSTMARFADADGTYFRVERARSSAGGAALWIVASRETSGRTIEMFLELNAETHQPMVERVRLREGGRVVELRLIAETTVSLQSGADSEIFSRNWAERIVFGTSVGYGNEPDGVAPLRRAPKLRQPEGVIDGAPSPEDLLQTELEVRYVLHHTGACLGEPLDVILHPGSHIEVTGLVDSNERRAQLMAALEEAGPKRFLRIEIQTTGSLLDATAEPGSTASMGDRSGQAATPAAVGSRITVTSSSRRRTITELLHYFRERGMTASAAEGEVIRLSDRVVALTESMLAEAGALRHLSDALGPDRVASMRPQSKWLLEVMLRDHERAMSASARELRGLLEPGLAKIAGATPGSPTDAGSAGGMSWNQSGEALYEAARRFADTALAVFAATEEGGGMSAEDAVGNLLSQLGTVQTSIAGVNGALAREFAGDPRRVSGGNSHPTGMGRE